MLSEIDGDEEQSEPEIESEITEEEIKKTTIRKTKKRT